MGSKLENIYLETRSFTRARRFWETLGFHLKDRWRENNHTGGLFMRDQFGVIVTEVDTVSKGGADVVLEVDDACALEAQLRRRRLVVEKMAMGALEILRVLDADGRAFYLKSTN
jgi:hypothetical protein